MAAWKFLTWEGSVEWARVDASSRRVVESGISSPDNGTAKEQEVDDDGASILLRICLSDRSALQFVYPASPELFRQRTAIMLLGSTSDDVGMSQETFRLTDNGRLALNRAGLSSLKLEWGYDQALRVSLESVYILRHTVIPIYTSEGFRHRTEPKTEIVVGLGSTISRVR